MTNQVDLHPCVELISTIMLLVALSAGVVLFWGGMRIGLDSRKADLYEHAPVVYEDDGLPNDSARPRD